MKRLVESHGHFGTSYMHAFGRRFKFLIMFAQIVARTVYPLICSKHGKRSTQTSQVISLLVMSFKINVVQADGKFSMQQWKRLSIDKCLILEINIWIGNGWFYMIGTPHHAVLIKDHKTRLLFPSPVYYGPSPMSHAVVSFTLCLFFYSQWLTSCLVPGNIVALQVVAI